MRHGLDKSLLSIDFSPARPDQSGRRGAAGQRDGEVSAFQLPSEAPVPQPSGRDRRTAAAARTLPVAGSQARDETPRQNTASRRADPPRRDDPPRRAGPRDPDEVRRRDDPPRREDAPGLSRAEERRRSEPDKAAGGDETEEPLEEPSSEPGAPDAAAAIAAVAEPPPPAASASDTAQTPSAEGATPASPVGEGGPVQLAVALPAPEPAGGAAGAVQGAGNSAAPGQTEVATFQGGGAPEDAEPTAGKKHPDEMPSAGDPAEGAKSEAAPELAKSDPSAGKAIQAADAKPEPSQGAHPGLQHAAGKASPDMRAPDAAPQAPAAHQVPLGAVPIEIGLKSLSGINRFEIRLDPAELGRIDVRLDIDESGEVKAHLVVDRVETLALLQRDAKTLERAFEQAGLKPSEGGVDLSLRDPSDGRQQGQARDERSGRQADHRDAAARSERPEVASAPAKRIHWRGTGGVDLRI